MTGAMLGESIDEVFKIPLEDEWMKVKNMKYHPVYV